MRYTTILTFLVNFNLSISIGQTYSDSIIDIHAHLWRMERSADDYVKARNNINIRTGGIIIIQKPGDPEGTRNANDKLINLCKSAGGFFPVCSIHPYDGDSAISELRRLKELGVKVIKLHPISQEFEIEDPRVSRVVAEAGKLGIVVLMDAYTFFQKNNVEKLIYLAYSHRSTKFIFAHLGGPEFQKFAFLGYLRRTNSWFADNMWFDISGTVNIFADSPYKDELEWAIRTVGVEKVLFGSDFPQFSLEETIQAVNKLSLTKQEKNLIMYLNAKKLLGLN